mmetsp:Transcript_6265/g.9223  ORF Transcript_6265/g.9223 Transcript_6265/m.9223 type:complete len:154 (+) Transcript_6265:829-1290(+)
MRINISFVHAWAIHCTHEAAGAAGSESSFLILESKANMLVVAIARAPVEMLNAPVSPNRFKERKTLTTSAFSGMPNRFIITDRCESGTYLLRSVPIDGKYIPTHPSNKKKLAVRAQRDGPAKVVTAVAPAIARVARDNMLAVKVSVLTPFFVK